MLGGGTGEYVPNNGGTSNVLGGGTGEYVPIIGGTSYVLGGQEGPIMSWLMSVYPIMILMSSNTSCCSTTKTFMGGVIQMKSLSMLLMVMPPFEGAGPGDGVGPGVGVVPLGVGAGVGPGVGLVPLGVGAGVVPVFVLVPLGVGAGVVPVFVLVPLGVGEGLGVGPGVGTAIPSTHTYFCLIIMANAIELGSFEARSSL